MEPPSVFVYNQPFQLSKQSHGEENEGRWSWRKGRRQMKTCEKFGVEKPCNDLNSAILDDIFLPREF